MSLEWDAPTSPAPVPGYGTPPLPAVDQPPAAPQEAVATPSAAVAVEARFLDDPAVSAALAARERAETADQVTRDGVQRAHEAVANARGAVEVARAKVEDYENDEDKRPWQLLAAGEEVEKAGRLVQQRERELATRERAAEAAEHTSRRAQAALAAALAEAEEAEPPADEAGVVEPYYGNAVQFFDEFLRHAYSRAQEQRIWCARWWEIPEALMRMEALWRAWEHLRTDPTTGASVWWRDHADHHMNVLLNAAGPFAKFAEGEENRLQLGEPLPHIAPPEGLFRDVRVAAAISDADTSDS